MADVKISELTALASANVDASGDVLAVVDTSATATRKITVENLLAPITINKASNVITSLGTVSAATSITSSAFVGPLTGNVTGNVSGTAPAGTLTGATLASGVTASSLTSVGTITSGVWNAGAVTSSGVGTFADSLSVSKSQNSETAISIENLNTESAGHAELLLKNSNGNVGGLRAHSSGFTTSNSSEADGFTIESYRQILHLVASNDKDIKFWNGTSNNVTFANGGNATFAGDVRIGATSLTPSGDKSEFVVQSASHGGGSFLGPDGAEVGIFTGHASSTRVGEFHTRYDTNTMTIGSAKSGMSVLLISGARATALTLDSSQNATFAGKVNFEQEYGDVYRKTRSKRNNGTGTTVVQDFTLEVAGISAWSGGMLKVRASGAVANLAETGYLTKEYRFAQYDGDSFSLTEIADQSNGNNISITFPTNSGNNLVIRITWTKGNSGTQGYMSSDVDVLFYGGITSLT